MAGPVSTEAALALLDGGEERGLSWFDPTAFSADAFDADAYVRDVQRHVPLDAVRSALDGHQQALQAELVELINRDYADFVSLSTQLVDVSGAVARMRGPLAALASRCESAASAAESALGALQAGLARRAVLADQRSRLQLHVDAAAAVAKAERLLGELGACAAADEPQLLGRAAGELARAALAATAHPSGGGGDGPGAGLGARAGAARSALAARLRGSLQATLAAPPGPQADADAAARLAAACAAHCDGGAAAAALLRELLVAPLVGGALDLCAQDPTAPLAVALAALDAAAAPRAGLLLRPPEAVLRAAAVGPRAVAAHAHALLHARLPHAFSPGRPDAFAANHAAARAWADALAGAAAAGGADAGGCAALRSELDGLMARFNTGAYVALRAQEVAAPLEAALAGGAAAGAGAGAGGGGAWGGGGGGTAAGGRAAAAVVAAAAAAAAGAALQPPPPGAADAAAAAAGGARFATCAGAAACVAVARPWAPAVYVPALADRLLSLSLQAAFRLARWASRGAAARARADVAAEAAAGAGPGAGGGGGGAPAPGASGSPAFGCEWALGGAPEELAALGSDAGLLAALLAPPEGALARTALRALSRGGLPPDGLAAAGDALAEAAAAAAGAEGALRGRAAAALAERCTEVLRQLRGITAVYRLTNKPPPTRASHFMPGVMTPLRAFMDSPRAAALPGSARVLLVGAVAEMVTGRYEEMARDLVTTSRKTESSLKRLSARRGGAGAAPGGAPGGGGDAGLSDTDKICRQLQLDVAEFGRQLGRFGLEAAAMPCFKALQAAVDETA